MIEVGDLRPLKKRKNLAIIESLGEVDEYLSSDMVVVLTISGDSG